MKTRSNLAMAVLLLLQIFWPAMKLISYFTPMEFYLHSELMYLLLICAATLWLCLYLYRQDDAPSQWLSLLLLPVTVIAGTLEILFFRTVFTIPLSALRLICAGAIYSWFVPQRWYRHLNTFVCTLLFLAYFWMCWMGLIFGQIGNQHTVQELPSPDGEKVAALIDDNQGALGGNTLVNVRYRDVLPLGFGGLRPDSKQIYRGSWGSHKQITLFWHDENTLLIDDIPYNVP